MTTAGHARYDELAAGHALHALDPADEADFAGHLPDCPRCQEAVARYTDVTAALAASLETEQAGWPADEPAPDLRSRILTAAAAEPQRDRTAQPQRDRQDNQVPRHRRPAGRRPARAIAAGVAAAAALVAGGVTWSSQLSQGHGPGQNGQPAAACAQAPASCREIVLTAAGSHAPAARLIIVHGTAWLIPSGLAADDAARQVYVLWQITGAHTPLAVGSFDVRGHAAVRVGALAVPYHGTWAFAVSLENGRTIPATPSHPVALGQVSA